jgi:GT2 family glycosyltransferase
MRVTLAAEAGRFSRGCTLARTVKPVGGCPLVYASILYWQPRELEFLQSSVESLLAQGQSERFDLRVLVVDNGCGLPPGLPDDPRVDLIRLAHNVGFAGGHNTAMRRGLEGDADYFFLFNSDAVAGADCLEVLVAAAETAPRAAFVGPVLVGAQNADTVQSAGQSFGFWSARHREIARGRAARSIGLAPRPVDSLSGCALLARRAAIETIGLLDEDLFAYFEDMDWCLRGRQAGYEVLVVPRARVSHAGQGSSGTFSPLSTYYSVRNHLLVAARYARGPSPVLQLLVVIYHLGYLARSATRRTGSHFAALVEGARAAWSRQTGAWPTHAHRD